MSKTDECLKWLDDKGINYELVKHEPAYTVDDILRMGVDSHGIICKNLFLRDAKGKRHFLVVLRSDKQADLKSIGEKLGAHLSFASEERLAKYLNLTKGAVTPLGVMYDANAAVEVLLDSELDCGTPLGVHPCENDASVFLSYAQLVSLIESNGNKLLTAPL